MQYALHLAACQLFQSGAHDGHTVQEQRNAAQQRGNVCDIHNDTPNMKLPFYPLQHTAAGTLHVHSTCPVPEAAYFYYTIKGGVSTRFILQESYFFHTFRNIFPGVKPKAFFHFTYILHCIFLDAVCPRLPGQLLHGLPHRVGRKQEHTTAGVYLHMTAHITQLKILHGVSLLCVCFVPGASPVNTVSHNSSTIKRIFKHFGGFFAQKSEHTLHLLTMFAANATSDRLSAFHFAVFLYILYLPRSTTVLSGNFYRAAVRRPAAPSARSGAARPAHTAR